MTLEEVTLAVAAQTKRALPPGVELVLGSPTGNEDLPRCFLRAKEMGVERGLGGRYSCRIAYEITYRRPPGESGGEEGYPAFLDALEELLDAIPFPAAAPETVLHTTGRTRAWDSAGARAELMLSLRLSKAPAPETAMGELRVNREGSHETQAQRALSKGGL